MPKPILGVDWSKLQIEYMTGQLNCTELAEKYAISAQAIAKRCSRERWKAQRTKAVQIVSERTVERVVDMKMSRIQAHHDLVVPIAERVCTETLRTMDDFGGQAIEPSHLHGIASSLKVANDVCLKNLGWVPVTAVDVTSGGAPLHARALAMLEAVRTLDVQGKLGPCSDIDTAALLKELEESKAKE